MKKTANGLQVLRLIQTKIPSDMRGLLQMYLRSFPLMGFSGFELIIWSWAYLRREILGKHVTQPS